MSKLILATLRDTETNNEYMATFTSWSEYHTATFSPLIDVLFITDFKVKGKTYADRKEFVRNIAIDYSNNGAFGLSWGEVAMISDMFYKLGKRYGLLKEFKENCIC